MPDPRGLRGRRHPLIVILVLAACATLVVGNDFVAAIWQWAAGTGQDVLARLDARYDALTGRYLVPSERTFRRVLTSLDSDALDAAVSGYFTDVIRGVSPIPVLPATAGPVEREQRRAATRALTHRSRPDCCRPPRSTGNCCTAPSPRPAGCSWSPRSAMGPQSWPASGRSPTNAVRAPLSSPCWPGWTWPRHGPDAGLHTTKKTARLITGDLHAHYVLILKGNQPLTLQTAQALLSGTDVEFADHTAIDTDRGHGRTERRSLRLTPANDDLFPGARQVFRLRRDTGGLDTIRTRKEIVYGITSTSAELAGPVHLNHYAREHWCVENRLHWVTDVTFHEDDSQLRTGSAPRALATFRNLATSTYRLAGRANIAHARRDLHDRVEVFAVYGI